MNEILHDSDIPFGNFCYAVVEILPGQPDPITSSRFGYEVREAFYHVGRKQVLCPHWRLTDHGTVCCTKLGVEAISDYGGYQQNLEKARVHFGSAAAFEAKRVGDHFLPDEIKICAINMEDDFDQGPEELPT
jgi:hypothetical protein